MGSCTCSFSSLVDQCSPCGTSSDYPTHVEVVTLRDCSRDVLRHLESYGISGDEAINSELKLLLARAGIFDVQVSHKVLTICPRHRAEFGIRWRCRKIKCSVPEEVAAHKFATSKADRRVNSSISAYVLKNTGKLVQVGSPICSLCKNYIVKDIQEQQTMTASALPEIILTTAEVDKPDGTKPPFSPEESSSERSEDEFAESFSRLQVGDDTFLSPDTESTASTQSEDSSAKNNPRRKLNDFLVACKIEPLEKPWLNWQDSSGATRQRYTKKATETGLKINSSAWWPVYLNS